MEKRPTSSFFLIASLYEVGKQNAAMRQEIVQEQADITQFSEKNEVTCLGSGRVARLERDVIILLTYKNEISNNGSIVKLVTMDQ